MKKQKEAYFSWRKSTMDLMKSSQMVDVPSQQKKRLIAFLLGLNGQLKPQYEASKADQEVVHIKIQR